MLKTVNKKAKVNILAGFVIWTSASAIYALRRCNCHGELAIQSGCATMILESFEGNQFTLCCSGLEEACDFVKNEKKICPGQASLLSGQRQSKVAGYESTYTTSSGSDTVQENTKTIKERVYCRTYKCSEAIDPDGLTKKPDQKESAN